MLEPVSRAYAHDFDHPESASELEAGVIGDFLQDVSDYGEVYDEIGPAGQIQAKFEMSKRLRELQSSGQVILVNEFEASFEIGDIREPFQTAVVKIVREPASRAESPEGRPTA